MGNIFLDVQLNIEQKSNEDVKLKILIWITKFKFPSR